MCRIAWIIPDEVLYDTKMNVEDVNDFVRKLLLDITRRVEYPSVIVLR